MQRRYEIVVNADNIARIKQRTEMAENQARAIFVCKLRHCKLEYINEQVCVGESDILVDIFEKFTKTIVEGKEHWRNYMIIEFFQVRSIDLEHKELCTEKKDEFVTYGRPKDIKERIITFIREKQQVVEAEVAEHIADIYEKMTAERSKEL